MHASAVKSVVLSVLYCLRVVVPNGAGYVAVSSLSCIDAAPCMEVDDDWALSGIGEVLCTEFFVLDVFFRVVGFSFFPSCSCKMSTVAVSILSCPNDASWRDVDNSARSGFWEVPCRALAVLESLIVDGSLPSVGITIKF